MATALQYTVSWLVQKLNALPAAVERERVRISENNARIMQADREANAITDPVKRAEVKRAIGEMVKRQVAIVRMYRSFGVRFSDAYAQAKRWLADHGLLAQSGLSGLDAAPLVPIALGAAVVALIGVVSWLAGQNSSQASLTAAIRTKVQQYLGGEIDVAQLRNEVSVLTSLYDKQTPPDPLGLKGLAEALVPLGLVVLGFFVLPPIVQSFTRGGARRRSLPWRAAA